MPLDFVLEIGCEEIPARFVEGALGQLAQALTETLGQHSLHHESIRRYATPRRLAVTVDRLSERQPDRSEFFTGPPYSVAFDSEGRPTAAATGFASKNQIGLDALKKVETDRGEYLGFEKRIAGQTAHAVLAAELPELLKSLEFPKNMRWEESQFTFVRPIRWILCLMGNQVVDFSVAGVQASCRTYGHRVLTGNRLIEVGSPGEYLGGLFSACVVIDPDARRQRIEMLLHQEAEKYSYKLREDKKLVAHVVYLNEHPTVVSGSFDPAFLQLPEEVLITVMREHQKYFSVVDGAGRLAPRFLAVVDSDGTHAERISAGHERVLRARLVDAKFFWEKDCSVPLSDRIEALNRIIFQLRLGTVLEKTKRLAALVDFLCRLVKKPELRAITKQASELCKADLTTEMVKEFTDLQGIMGGLYARAQGVSDPVAEAIYEHYKPASLEDSSPDTMAGALLSLGDKVDSVVGAFSIGLVPTGSKDPLALRRQTLGVIKVLLEKKLHISLQKLFVKSFKLFRSKVTRPAGETQKDFVEFVKDRLRFIFKEQGFRYDEVNAVIEIAHDNPLDCLQRLNAIASMRASHDFASVCQSFKRIKNILVKADWEGHLGNGVNSGLFEVPDEHELLMAVDKITPRVRRARRKGDYTRSFELMASMRPQIDRFFDTVLVMADNPKVRENRLELLSKLFGVFLELADVSQIVTSPDVGVST